MPDEPRTAAEWRTEVQRIRASADPADDQKRLNGATIMWLGQWAQEVEIDAAIARSVKRRRDTTQAQRPEGV